ncbi:MAG: chemotaxis protein CheW [Alphaproteobacteria bacterium]|nr:chemotaxis protein CheW [Rhodospirillales bacterium]MCW9045049.1 chemotaxis protein CheW [Alphaproteobacteria bacterium]
MDDLLVEFLTETSENLATIDVELVKFEQDPNDADILSNIFRLVHTIKGTCGFLGLPRLEKVAHAGENVLGKFRDGSLEVTPGAVTLILECIDTIKDLLGILEETEEEPEGNDDELRARLNALADGLSEDSAPAAVEAAPAAASGGPVLNDQGFPVAAELLAEVEASTPAPEASSGGPVLNEQGFPVAAELLAEVAGEAAPAPAAPAPTPAPAPVEAKAPEPKKSVPARRKKSEPAAKKAEGKAKETSVAAQTIRVNVELLENLMTLVSELVLTRNQLMQIVRGRDDNEFVVPLQRLSHITSDLQEGVMKTRMQPIGNAWAKLPRIVRDLSVESGKKIDLQMIGADTELDRQVLELIKDPLTHMVRNSADHGLEDPQGRLDANKPETGVVVLRAFHEGGHIIIEIADDGRGLNMDRIVDKIISNGLASESDLESMSDRQIQQYIFRAGFSTAEKVTSVSGRGVGMDVVRTNIEKIGGTIELKSEEGYGSTFTIKIPLTLAIVSALIVAASSERFAIPQISVVELVRASANSEMSVEMINEAAVLRLRNRLLPLVSLHDLLKLDGEKKNHLEDELFIVVTQVGTYSFGIIVDRVYDTEEIVVKPVAPILRNIPVYSGNTILGDGSVIMILDPNGIAANTGEGSGGGRTDDSAEDGGKSVSRDDLTSLLIFRAGTPDLKAVPLGLVARLEEVDLASVEHSGGRPVVQYRGQLMPLVTINHGHVWEEEGRQPILVFTDSDRSMGLVVDEIVDIVEDKLKIELSSDGVGLMGSAVINGKATEMVDAGYYLTEAFADWFGNQEQDSGVQGGVPRSILLVDDSPFFRNLLTPLLSVAGYEVTAVEDAEEALELRENGADFDVIISDIEMPGMSGFEFAQAVRAEGRWASVPMVALSSHSSETDFDRGRAVGFSDYVAKSDRDGLISALAEVINFAQEGQEEVSEG